MEDRGRKPPYCAVASLEEFLKATRNLGVPENVDKRYLQRLRVARSNEWALLSALKFLGILDDRGRPTVAYQELQTSEWRAVLGSLVANSYAALLDVGGSKKSQTELADYFALSSSPSQAKNAARFFRGVLDLAGATDPGARAATVAARRSPPEIRTRSALSTRPAPSLDRTGRLLAMQEEVLSWMPDDRTGWTAAEYASVIGSILEILKVLDVSPGLRES